MWNGWYRSEEKFYLLLIHLKFEVRPRRSMCFEIKNITLEVRKRFMIMLFLFYKSINQSSEIFWVLKLYNSSKILNINPFSVSKISTISLIHYICSVISYVCMYVCKYYILSPTRSFVISYTFSALFHFYAFVQILSSVWNALTCPNHVIIHMSTFVAFL